MRPLRKQGADPEVSGLSAHFLERRGERRIKMSDVKESLKNPRLSFRSGDASVFIGPKVTVVIGSNGRLITAYRNRKSEYKGSRKKDIRDKRRRKVDRQDAGIPGLGFGFAGEEG